MAPLACSGVAPRDNAHPAAQRIPNILKRPTPGVTKGESTRESKRERTCAAHAAAVAVLHLRKAEGGWGPSLKESRLDQVRPAAVAAASTYRCAREGEGALCSCVHRCRPFARTHTRAGEAGDVRKARARGPQRATRTFQAGGARSQASETARAAHILMARATLVFLLTAHTSRYREPRPQDTPRRLAGDGASGRCTRY